MFKLRANQADNINYRHLQTVKKKISTIRKMLTACSVIRQM